ncbi:MAG: hypothetical protein ACI8Q1_002582, partial [Parvicella sp.]
LFIAADGPRPEFESDRLKCEECIHFVLNEITWDCEVQTLFREENLGCKFGPSTAITWFFEKVELGIILEDDIVPSSYFFNLSEQILEKYRDNKKVMHFGGVNFLKSNSNNADFYFSKICHGWGWATWKDRWEKYNINFFEGMSETDFDELFKQLNFNNAEKKFWNGIRLEVQNGLDAWDYSWQFTIWLNDGVSIVPLENLVKNIGTGFDATHTATVPTLNLPTEGYRLTGKWPKKVEVNRNKDTELIRFIRGKDINKFALLKRVVKRIARI